MKTANKGQSETKKIKILLLTNMDSENVGDQIIEATVISLLKAVMGNLDYQKEGYEIISKPAGIISKKYMQTKDPALLENAIRLIRDADILVFGGAPLFNYTYQRFYKRTIKTLELAEEYGVPVIFSSIGVEPYDENNKKCLALREALSLSCVKQITTRDDLDSLKKFVKNTNVPVSKVADPAVFADIVFAPKPKTEAMVPKRPFAQRTIPSLKRRVKKVLHRKAKRPQPTPDSEQTSARKRIGLVVTRAGIFKDNGISFSEQDQRTMWKQIIELLDKKGYDCRLFTTGHFSDEVFLDAFARKEGFLLQQYMPAINSPEELIAEIRACTGIIAYRLHASITAYAYGVPSIGLSWNFKIPYFYEAIGRSERAFDPESWDAPTIVAALEKALEEGVSKDASYMMTVYETLFSGLKNIFMPESKQEPYAFDDLLKCLPHYAGTSQKKYRKKIERKLRRTYDAYFKYVTFYEEHQS